MMKKGMVLGGVLLALSMAASAQAADVLGQWKTPNKNGVVEITKCGDSICGTLISSDGIAKNPGLQDTENKDPALRTRTLKGLLLISGFKGGPTEWTDGKIYNPEDGNTYTSTVKLLDDKTLEVKGCIMVPLCRTYIWKR